MSQNERSLKKILVTGAQGALGTHVVQRFLNGGCEVIGTYLKKMNPNIIKHPKLEWLDVDITDSQAVHNAMDGKSFDGVIHCAGGFRFATVENTSDDALDFLLNTNLRSTFYLLREILPRMKKQNFGRIILISSRATLLPTAGMSAYEASKSGLNMLVGSLAEEVKEFDINVNALLPTVIDTPANRKDMSQADFKKWVKPEEIAEIAFSLTQDFGKPIHGALIPVSGRV